MLRFPAVCFSEYHLNIIDALQKLALGASSGTSHTLQETQTGEQITVVLWQTNNKQNVGGRRPREMSDKAGGGKLEES